MCFNKNTPESNLNKILKGKMQINELDLRFKENEDTAIVALNIKPILARKLNLGVAAERSVLIKWLKKDPKRIVNLDPSTYITDAKYDNEVLFLYLNYVLSDEREKKDGYSFSYSLNKFPVLTFNYETAIGGEEIRYFDNVLKLPASLLGQLNIAIKITDAYKFLKYLDVHIQQISMDNIYMKLRALISTTLNKAVLDTIAEYDLCYYQINSYYNVVVDKMTAAINLIFKDAGCNISDIRLFSIALFENYGKIYEKQRAIFMQKEKEAELKHKEELLSLEAYEKKAEIHKKYPDFEFGLTEKEKDNAIDRYINKTKGYIPQSYEKPTEKEIKKFTKALPQQKSVVDFNPEKESKLARRKNIPILLYVGILLLILGCSIVAFTILGGCMLIAAGIAASGVWLALKVNKSKQNEYKNIIDTIISSMPDDSTI